MRRVLAFVVIFLLSVSALGADTYFCPMKCEGEKVYTRKGNCPVCGMLLEKKTEGARPLNTREYRVDLATTPAEPKPGEKTEIVLTPRRTKDDSIMKDLEIVHEKPMHLILVSQNLATFQHLHPAAGADGVYRVETVFEQGGNHLAFVDLTPKGDRNQVFPLALRVSGKAGSFSLKGNTKLPAKLPGGYSVQLKLSPGAKAETPVTLTYRISKDAKQVTNLSEYLGAGGHLVIISEDTTQYVHAHPPGGHQHQEASATVASAAAGPEIVFMATFPRKGKYASWMQFQHQGKVHTAPFAIDVQ